MRYGMLLLKEIKSKFALALVSYILFALIFEIALDQSYARCEILFIVVAMAVGSYIFGSQDEMELFIVSKVRLTNIFTIRFIAVCLSLMVLPFVHLLLRSASNRVLISFITTVLFSCMIGAFWRVLLSSPFSTLIFSSVCCTALIFPSVLDQKWLNTYKMFAPFYSVELRGDMYSRNRILITGFAFILFVISCIILQKKEKT